MTLSTPAALLYLAALALTVLSRLFKKGSGLAYIGGVFWAAGTITALVDASSMTEVLVFTLLMLTAAGIGKRRAAP